MGPAIPIAAGIAGLTLVGLRLRAVAVAKGKAKVTPLPSGQLPNGQTLPPGTVTAGGGIISADGRSVLGGTDGGVATATNNIPFATPAAAAAQQAANVAAGFPAVVQLTPAPGSPAPTQTQLIAFIKDAGTPLGAFVDFSKATPADIAAAIDAMNAAPIPPASDGVAVVGQQAVVTTNDPPPSGDLIIRDTPFNAGIIVGVADKDGTVTVLDSSDDTFAKIQWNGGRNPPAIGFAHKQFLQLQ